MTNEKISPRKRHRARSFIVQALYQWQLTGDNISEIALQFLVEMNTKKTDTEYFRELLIAIPKECAMLDAHFVVYLDRPLAEVGPVELAILRLATFELVHHLEIPYKVILNEAVELAKTFGPEGSFKYLNGVLDKTTVVLRPIETAN
jgi:N utilization substance protein B